MSAETTPKAEADPAQDTNATPTAGLGSSPASAEAEPPKEPGQTETDAGEKPADKAEAPFALKLPEGQEHNPDVVSAFEGLAKQYGIKGEAAQAVWDTMHQKLAQVHQAEIGKWQDEIIADPKIGGANLQATMQAADKIVERFGSPKLREWFNKTGAGSNPELVRFVHGISQAMSEDSIAVGKPAPSNVRKSLGEVFFPELAK